MILFFCSVLLVLLVVLLFLLVCPSFPLFLVRSAPVKLVEVSNGSESMCASSSKGSAKTKQQDCSHRGFSEAETQTCAKFSFNQTEKPIIAPESPRIQSTRFNRSKRRAPKEKHQSPLERRKWRFKRWGFNKSEDIRGKRPFSSVLWISQELFGPGAHRRRAKKSEKGRKRPIPVNFQLPLLFTPPFAAAQSPILQSISWRKAESMQAKAFLDLFFVAHHQKHPFQPILEMMLQDQHTQNPENSSKNGDFSTSLGLKIHRCLHNSPWKMDPARL